MKTTIYMIRHGESIGNKLKRMLGHTDMGLTDLGLSQAEATANALADIKIDAIYSSDLSRAMQTATPNAKLRQIDVFSTPDLREIYLGDWENAAVEDLISSCYEKFTVEWRDNFGTFKAPNGESVPEVAQRMYSAVIKIAASHPGQTIIITTHAAAIRALWGKISGISAQNLAKELPFPSNASYSIIEYEGEKLIPIKYSVDDHLASMITVWRDE